MAIAAGSYTLGPDDGMLSVRTRKAGAAAKAGHNLLIEVTSWSGTLALGDDGASASIELTADPRSLKVLEGAAIEFRSTAVRGESNPNGGAELRVSGELKLAGRRNRIAFELTAAADGRLAGAATVKQSGWGIKPYSSLFGALKVLDEVTVEIAARLPRAAVQSLRLY